MGDSKEKHIFRGSFRVSIAPGTPIHVFCGGSHKVIKLFEQDKLQKIFRNLYLGKFNKSKKYTAGQVPAKAFRLKKIPKILGKVKIKLKIRN